MNLLDDIYIWSNQGIYSIRFEDYINSKIKCISDVFNYIFKHINKKGYDNKVIIFNKNIRINKNFINLFEELILNFKKDYQILQLGVYNPGKDFNYNKIISIGSFIINLKKLDLDKFDFRSINGYPNNILSISSTLTLHPEKYKSLCILKQTYYVNNYIELNYQFLIENKNKLLNKISNPFLNIEQVVVSNSLSKFNDRIKSNYKLTDYKNKNDPCIFFGMYNINDLNIFLNHKGKKYIIWGGSDINMELSQHNKIVNIIKENKVDFHFAISLDIKKRLDKLGFENKLVNFNLVDESIFKPIISYGNKIYVYNGTKKGREEIYGKKYYIEIKKRLPEFEFIFSNTLNKKYEEMPSVYKECFIGLRLTKNDGNANTVQEMKAMNIPVIHNGEDENSLSWDNVDDIELRIRYRNIDLFNRKIKKYKKILFICSDYPNYGGAATNTFKMIEYFEKIGKNVFGIFHSKDIEINYKSDKNNIEVISNRDLFNYLTNLEFKPDLIILRNFITFNINDIFNCPNYFLIPGIFGPNLNTDYKNLTDQKLKKFINRNVINTIKHSSISYCASAHTKDILYRLYKFNIEIYYFNYIPYYGKFIKPDKDFDKREYDYGIIVSDFNRKIKNTDYFINKLKNTNYKVILIGKNSEKFNIYSNFTTFENIGHDNIMGNPEIFYYMKKIKVILQKSYYESCSNVLVESRFNGCLIMSDLNNNNLIKRINNNFVSKVSKIIPKLENYDFKKKSKILIVSTQYPYYGGAATCSYHSISYLKKLGYKVCCIYFTNVKDVDVDPYKFGGVLKLGMKQNLELKKHTDNVLIKNFVMKELSGYPDMIFGWNYGAPILIKNVFPNTKLIYVITGVPTISLGNNIEDDISVRKVLELKDKKMINYDQYIIEKKCIEFSNICLPYTKLIEIYFGFLYSKYNEKLYPFLNTAVGNIIDHTEKIIENKSYDLIAVASNWFRKVKNLPFLIDVFKKYPNLKKIIIGLEINSNNDTYENKRFYEDIKLIPNLTILPKIEYSELQKYIAKSKLLLIPSISESGPNVLLEALYQNCQVISSKNIGFFNIINEKLLCNSCYDLDEWTNKINYIFKNYKKIKIDDINYLKVIEKHKMIDFISFNKNEKKKKKIKIVFISCDVPNHGGAATNTYNLYNNLKSDLECYCIFISSINYKVNENEKDRIFIINEKKLDLDLPKIINKINKNKSIDIVFFKNYKVYAYSFLYFNNVIKIFSPSGLRSINKIVSENNLFVNNKKVFKIYEKQQNKFDNNKITLNKNNIIELLKRYELGIENYVFNDCDYILTNSILTKNTISKNNNYKSKFLNTINLTNINYKLRTNRKNYYNRKYDIAFICYNWKRKCKNYELVNKIIDNDLIKDKKILVIGLNQNKYKNNNVDSINNLDKKSLFEIMNNIKIIVITSLYDSNPNVLIEGVSNGCNIITSSNVGGSEFINSKLIVKNYILLDDWVKTIIDCNKSYAYHGYPSNLIKNDLILQFKNLIKKKNKFNNKIMIDIVGIYKIPAVWDNLEIKKKKNFYYFKEKLGNIKENKTRFTDINDNIYFDIFRNIVKVKKFKYAHFIFVDEFSKNNYKFIKDDINIWVLNDICNLYNFNLAKFYFIRGNYHNFYNNFLPPKSFKIFYPATSFKYNYNFKNKIVYNRIKQTLNIKRDFNYDIVLSHEDKNYNNVFKNSKIVLFEKYHSNCFCFLNIKRFYDIIFVADAIQDTKNHNLMFDFINYCESKEFELKIAYVSNVNILRSKYKNFRGEENCKYVKITFFYNLEPDNLCLLYNKSKINLILSGRDCCPRVISESLICGCFNIALSTLSDGKFYYKDILGKILHFENNLIENRNRSLCYVKNFRIWFNILYYVYEVNFDHQKISNLYERMFDKENFYKKLINLI